MLAKKLLNKIAIGESYWIAYWQDGKGLYSMRSDSAGLTFCFGRYVSGTGKHYVLEIDVDGDLVDQYGVDSTNATIMGMFDGSDVHVMSDGCRLYYRYSGGALQESEAITLPGTLASNIPGADANSSVIAYCSNWDSTYAGTFVASLTGGGSTSGIRINAATAGNELTGNVRLDSSDNTHTICRIPNGTYTAINVYKANSSGTLSWQREVNHGSTGFIDASSNASVDIDGSGNVYINTAAYDTDDKFSVLKWDSSGSLQWKREITVSTGGTITSSGKQLICVDDSGNVYAIIRTYNDTEGEQGCFIAKWDSSGSLQWDRMLYFSGDTSVSLTGVLWYDGSVFIGWKYTDAGTGYSSLAKLPDDGSLTGTYGSFVYIDTDYTEGASSVTETAGDATFASTSTSSAAGSLSQDDPSFTVNKQAVS